MEIDFSVALLLKLRLRAAVSRSQVPEGSAIPRTQVGGATPTCGCILDLLHLQQDVGMQQEISAELTAIKESCCYDSKVISKSGDDTTIGSLIREEDASASSASHHHEDRGGERVQFLNVSPSSWSAEELLKASSLARGITHLGDKRSLWRRGWTRGPTSDKLCEPGGTAW